MTTKHLRASAKLAMLILMAAATIFITKQDVVASYDEFASCEQTYLSNFNGCENSAQSNLQSCNSTCFGPGALNCSTGCQNTFNHANDQCFIGWSGNQNQCVNIYVQPARRSQASCDREANNTYAACIHEGNDEQECEIARSSSEANCTYP